MREEDNPYNPGAGARPPELAGRDAIIRKAEVTIRRTKAGRSPKSLMLLGLRGVGKTVLLNEFEQIAEADGCQTILFEADEGRTLAEQITPQLHQLLLKLNRIAMAGHSMKRVFGLLQGFASAFKVKHGDTEISISEPVTGDLVLDLTELLIGVAEAAKARKSAAIILIDEVHSIGEKDLGALIMALHKISQRQLPLLVFGAGLPLMAKLAGDAKSYAERLFDYPQVDRLDEASARIALVGPAIELGIAYEEAALRHIIKETAGYPFFLQLWGSFAWEVCPSSPITEACAREATQQAKQNLDEGTFNLRYERLTERHREYARALAELGPEPARSGEVAALLGMTVSQAAPIRDEIIKKGMAYSPKRGYVAFTAPLFDEFMRRRMPDFTPRKKKNKIKRKQAK